MRIRIHFGEISLSMPQLIAPTDFALDTMEKNQLVLKKLMRKKSIKPISQFGKYTLYATGLDNAYGYLFLTDGVKIAYFVRFEAGTLYALGRRRTVTQVAVWRDPLVRETKNLSEHVFFETLLEKHGVMMSDRQQTERGKIFWLNRISDALYKGFRIYSWNQVSKTLKEYYSEDSLREDIKLIWGTDGKYRTMRVLISKEPIEL